jgi:hypothetical protein
MARLSKRARNEELEECHKYTSVKLSRDRVGPTKKLEYIKQQPPHIHVLVLLSPFSAIIANSTPCDIQPV